MRNVQDREFSDALRVEQRGTPGYDSAPIVAGEEDAFAAELIHNGDDVGDKLCKCVGFCSAGLAAFVVAALVGHDDAEAGSGERRDLPVPRIPELREAVQEQYDRAIWRASGYGVKFHAAVLKSDALEL